MFFFRISTKTEALTKKNVCIELVFSPQIVDHSSFESLCAEKIQTTRDDICRADDLTTGPDFTVTSSDTTDPYPQTSMSETTAHDLQDTTLKVTTPETSTSSLSTYHASIETTSVKNTTRNVPDYNTRRLLHGIVQMLSIDTQNTSAYRRSKTSADDQRVSSQVIGGMGMTILITIFSVIFIGDVTYLVKFFCLIGRNFLESHKASQQLE